MFVNFSNACFRLLVRALTVAILIPSLIHEQYYAFIVTVCVFSLGQMIEYIGFMEKSVSKMVHVICSIGCLLAIVVSVICFIYFAGLAITADSGTNGINGITEQGNTTDNEVDERAQQFKTSDSTPETIGQETEFKNTPSPRQGNTMDSEVDERTQQFKTSDPTPEIIGQETEYKSMPSPFLTFVVWVTFFVSLYYVAVDFLVWVVAVLNGWKLKKQYSKSILHI